ncbi:hypothetical protein LX16_2903 [Stackebrandtia albiflava]|uniref:Uncharacterized protein n=1 Tax=Stackebrandtia albiflava TaxID=406432 RepID=A0A562V2M1_9ACTN|nr:hypothetical protein [Stackebrandtia albiflava]TWJ12150.1 hypothetical protein LX16_2903 [Stackebrandtia albiflava]
MSSRRFTRLAVGLGVAVPVVVLLFVGLTALGFPGSGFLGAAGSPETVDITVRDDDVAFVLEVPEGVGIDSIAAGPDWDGCERIGYGFDGAGLVVEAVSRHCDPDPSQQIINGDHGTYRTVRDVPEPLGLTRVDTYAGPADVFTQIYTEYTNTTTEYEEPVAIVTFDLPVNPDYPTLVIRSSQGGMDIEEFTTLVENLSMPS